MPSKLPDLLHRLVLLGGLLCAGAALAQTSTAREWASRVDPWVMQAVDRGDETEFLILLEAQADLSAARHLEGKEARGRFVFEQLTAVAAATQGPVLEQLRALGVEHRPFWVVNMVWARGDGEVVRAMAERGDVRGIRANPWVPLDEPWQEPDGEPETIAWGVEKIGAPAYWAEGYTGQGVVVAGADTGYDWEHEALKEMYRGWNGSAADHNYNWHDAIHSGGGSCGPDSQEPCDDGFHGTHTMGTMVGDNGSGEQIGVAPGARWIGCRNMNQGFGTPTTYAECFQFFIAPTDLNGQNPDPSKAPHVVNNSWVCPPSEGCTTPDILRAVVENTRATGILVAASAGNDGSGCESIEYPPAIYGASFTVGATTSADSIASYSSRGAVTVDGSNRLKPDISAPGSSIRSSFPGDGYGNLSGTSMAGPHVAGQVALILSAAPSLAGDVDALEDCIESTALPRTSAQTCSGVPGSQVPNNTFGWGRVQLVWPPPPACRPSLIFADGFESGDTKAWTTAVP